MTNLAVEQLGTEHLFGGWKRCGQPFDFRHGQRLDVHYDRTARFGQLIRGLGYEALWASVAGVYGGQADEVGLHLLRGQHWLWLLGMFEH